MSKQEKAPKPTTQLPPAAEIFADVLRRLGDKIPDIYHDPSIPPEFREQPILRWHFSRRRLGQTATDPNQQPDQQDQKPEEPIQ